jgi:hypothetical protein
MAIPVRCSIREPHKHGIDLNKPQHRYQTFLVAVREYSHILALKRAGRFHYPDGAAGTAEGELSIPCRACPHSGINMLPTPPAHRYVLGLYVLLRDLLVLSYLNTLFLNVDANFRLKNRAHKNGHADSPYGDGLSYFVDSTKFNRHLREYTHRDEVMILLWEITFSTLTTLIDYDVRRIPGLVTQQHEARSR